MNIGFLSKFVIAVSAAVLLSGCLVRRTVTSGGQVVESNYAVKRPLKDAIKRSH